VRKNDVTNDCATPIWAPRVPQHKIRQLYENDAQGLYDEALIDGVGYSLLTRCKSFVAANEATKGRVPCPWCSRSVPHGGCKEEMLRCECGWELSWDEYFETIQHKQLSGAQPVIRQFRDYVDRFPAARTAREKVLLIDQLIHGFHWYYKTNEPTRPVAVNHIEGRLRQVVDFLDQLHYGDKSTPGTTGTKAAWDRNIQPARGWYRDQNG
jgi:hypothetical protein